MKYRNLILTALLFTSPLFSMRRMMQNDFTKKKLVQKLNFPIANQRNFSSENNQYCGICELIAWFCGVSLVLVPWAIHDEYEMAKMRKEKREFEERCENNRITQASPLDRLALVADKQFRENFLAHRHASTLLPWYKRLFLRNVTGEQCNQYIQDISNAYVEKAKLLKYITNSEDESALRAESQEGKERLIKCIEKGNITCDGAIENYLSALKNSEWHAGIKAGILPTPRKGSRRTNPWC